MTTFPVTIIVPVHALNEETTTLLAAALTSVAAQKDYRAEQVLVVIPAGDEALETAARAVAQTALAAEHAPVNFAFVVQELGAGIAHQINAGVAAATTRFVTVLELDDELGLEYLAEMAKYTEAYPEMEGFLPLVASVSAETMQLFKYGNEGIWVPKTEEERPTGVVDIETVEVAPDLLLSGALLQKSLFTDGAPLKASIELAFVNEFYRRIVTRGNQLRGMGKVLYMHRERRPGSYIYEALMGEQPYAALRIQELFEAAKTESAFEIERPLTLTA